MSIPASTAVRRAVAATFGAAVAALLVTPATANPVTTPSPGGTTPPPPSTPTTGPTDSTSPTGPTDPSDDPTTTPTDDPDPGGVDLAAIGGQIRGAVGDVAKLTVGVKNVDDKPKVGYEDSPTVNIYINPPKGTTILPQGGELPQCARSEGRIYHCDFFGRFEPGQSKTVTLRVQIDRKVAGAEGTVTIPEHSNDDPNLSNNTAAITLSVSTGSGGGDGDELPNTGVPAGMLAATGTSALLLGVAAVLWTRRRSSAA